MERIERDRKDVNVLVGGAGRGARLMLPAVRDFNQRSDRFAIQPWYVDPQPERARELADEAQRIGVLAKQTDGRIERVVRENQASGVWPLILHVDRPMALADALRAAQEKEVPVLAYMLMRLASSDLCGLTSVLQAHEHGLKELAVVFFQRLAGAVARSGASFVVGEHAPPEHIAAEPRYRAWFATHMQSNLGKLVAELEPESSPFEITMDGQSTMWLILRDHRDGWMEPARLAGEVVAEPPIPIIRGEDFAIGEIGPDGIRIHRVRLRKTDGRVSVRGSSGIDRESILEARERELARREAELAIREAPRDMISRTRPAFTTD